MLEFVRIRGDNCSCPTSLNVLLYFLWFYYSYSLVSVLSERLRFALIYIYIYTYFFVPWFIYNYSCIFPFQISACMIRLLLVSWIFLLVWLDCYLYLGYYSIKMFCIFCIKWKCEVQEPLVFQVTFYLSMEW